MRTPLLTVLALLATAAPAAAQATATANPNTPGVGTGISFDLDATQPPAYGRVPSAVTLTAQPGFVLDPQAVASRCTTDQAAANACPADANIGTATVVANTPLGPQTVTLGLFIGAPQQPGDLAALLASGTALGMNISGAGRLVNSASGLQAILTTPSELGQFASSITVQRITATTVARTRVIRTYKTVKRKHKKPKRVLKSRTRHNLLTTPPSCDAGVWTASTSLTFFDSSMATVDAAIPCT